MSNSKKVKAMNKEVERSLHAIQHMDDATYEALVNGAAQGDNGARLALATYLVQEVIGTLDVRKKTCGTCGVNHYENWTERQAAVELGAMVQKMERIKASLKK